MIKTERIYITPFEMKCLNEYFNGFNAEITKYQYPDPYKSIKDARSMLSEFMDKMGRNEMLIFSIFSKNGEFIGSVEVHGLKENCPELGIWIIASEQNKGYGYEALNSVLDYVSNKFNKSEFYYEADIRNMGSIKLLLKLKSKYEIIEQEIEKLTTDSGKYLELQGYILKAR